MKPKTIVTHVPTVWGQLDPAAETALLLRGSNPTIIDLVGTPEEVALALRGGKYKVVSVAGAPEDVALALALAGLGVQA